MFHKRYEWNNTKLVLNFPSWLFFSCLLVFVSEVDCCYTATIGDEHFCTTVTPCGEDEGDCDSHDECQDGLFCGLNNCPASLGFDSEVDCCSSTQLVSPNYPNSYPNNAEETWLITAPTGSIITLQFHSFHVRFIVESKNRTKYEFRFSLLQTETNWDFVTIYDGLNDQSTQIAKLSGNLGSFSISSTGNSLFVKFESNGWGSYAGFFAAIHFGSSYLNIK